MVDKCASKVCSRYTKGRERRCNPESGRCKLATVNVKSDEELIWTLVSKARQRVKRRSCDVSRAFEQIIIEEKIDPDRVHNGFLKLRRKIPTQEENPGYEVDKFYNDHFIHSGGDSDADYQYQVIFGGKRTFYAFVNPKRTWAERRKIADEKLCIGQESMWF